MAKKKATKGEWLRHEKTRQEVINEAVLWVDWDKVRKVGKFLKLKWFDGEVPTTNELKESAIDLLEDAFFYHDEEKRKNELYDREFTINSNGIFARLDVVKGEVLTVSCGFMLEEYNTDMVENVLTEIETPA